MPRVQVAETPIELTNRLVEGLRVASVRPGLAGYKPQNYQTKFHASRKRGRLFMGGNRVGKTLSATADACMLLCGMHPVWTPKFGSGFIRGRAIGVDFDNGVELILIPEYKKWIPSKFLIDGSWEKSYNKSLRMLTLTNGSTIEFRSYDQDMDKFAGTSRHFIHMDEEPPENIFDENMARLIDTDGIWFISMTPLIDQSWTEDRLYTPGVSGSNPHIEVFEVPTSENHYVSADSIEALYFGMTQEARNARMAGEYQTYSRTVYRDYVTDLTFIDPIVGGPEWEKYKSTKYQHFIAVDHGLNNPTACVFGCVDSDENIIIYDEYYVSGQLVKYHAEAIKRKLRELGVRISYGVIDPSTKNRSPIDGVSVHSVYSEHGLPLALANNDLSAGIERVSNRLKLNKLHITRNCAKVRWELNRYRWGKFVSQKSTQTNNLKEKPVAKDDHLMDALRYIVVSRPALRDEVDTTRGNVFNKPVALSESAWVDSALDRRISDNNVPLDPVLGGMY